MLVGAAMLLRRRRDYHKRLMLLSCMSMIGPGLTRIPFDFDAKAEHASGKKSETA